MPPMTMEQVTDLEPIRHAYEEMAGTWTGCDWPTNLGKKGLDLDGWTAAQAAAMAAETGDSADRADWLTAARWLADVERTADEAAVQGALALAAANTGCICEALEHAQRAWMLERDSGRPAGCPDAPSWRQLHQAIEAALGPKVAPRQAVADPGSGTVQEQMTQLLRELEFVKHRIEQLEKEAVPPVAHRPYEALR